MEQLAPVVHGRETVIALLAGGVPDFELDSRVVHHHRLCEEGRCETRAEIIEEKKIVSIVRDDERTANCGFLIFVELSFDEAEDKRTLADRRFT